MARARDKGNRISSDYRTAPVSPRIRSKHSNLLNYFIHDRRDLSPAYVKSCEKFFKSLKPQAPSPKLQAPSTKVLDSHKIPDIK